MKNCLLLFSLFLSLRLFSQDTITSSIQLKHITGMKAVDAGFSWTKFGSGPNVSFILYTSNQNIFDLGINSEFGNIGLLDFRNLGARFVYNRTLGSAEQVVFLNFGAGVKGAVEEYKNNYLDYKQAVFTYGALANCTIEILFSKRIGLIIKADQIYTRNSKLGTFNWQLGGNLRCVL